MDKPSLEEIEAAANALREADVLKGVMSYYEGLAKLALFAAAQVRAQTHVVVQVDPRPANCRFRLRDEGKAYPRSSCTACTRSVVTGLGNSCHLSASGGTVTDSPVNSGTIWRHWKGKAYRVLGMALDAETTEHLVLYRDAENELASIWARPLSEWHHQVTASKKRFEQIGGNRD